MILLLILIVLVLLISIAVQLLTFPESSGTRPSGLTTEGFWILKLHQLLLILLDLLLHPVLFRTACRCGHAFLLGIVGLMHGENYFTSVYVDLRWQLVTHVEEIRCRVSPLHLYILLGRLIRIPWLMQHVFALLIHCALHGVMHLDDVLKSLL